MTPPRRPGRSTLRSRSLGVAGVLVVLVGVVSLGAVFRAERDEAVASVERASRVAAELGRRAVDDALRALQIDADEAIARHADDPLTPLGSAAVFEDDGTPLLPPRPPSAGADTRLRPIAKALLAGLDPALTNPGERRRAELAAEIVAAVRGDDSEAVTRATRAFLDDAARFVLPPDVAIASQLVAAETLRLAGGVAPELRAAIVVTGLDADERRRVPGLMAALLAARPNLSPQDEAFAAERIGALAAWAGDSGRRFAAARAITPRAPVVLTRPGPEVVGNDDGFILAWRDGWGTRSVTFGEELVEAVQTGLRERRFLPPDGVLTLRSIAASDAASKSIAGLSVAVSAGSWQEARRRADRLFWLKTALGLMCGLFGLMAAGLALLDVTRRARLVELKGDFVATVSHELKTPLAAIRLLGETLERRLKDLPKARDYPRRIVREADRLTWLVENILSFNRLERGRLTPARTRVDLGEVASSVRHELKDAWPGPHRVVVDVPVGATVMADAELLRLCLSNLVRNGLKYNDQELPTVRLSLLGGDVPRVVVEDNGRGLTDGDAQRVFEPFERGDSSQGRAGTGLGLSLCRLVARVHGGDVELLRTSPDGTAFALILPDLVVEETS